MLQLHLSTFQFHYYQPMWTLVGAGIKKMEQSAMPMHEVLPKHCVHYKQHVSEFDPDHNVVTLSDGQKVC